MHILGEKLRSALTVPFEYASFTVLDFHPKLRYPAKSLF